MPARTVLPSAPWAAACQASGTGSSTWSEAMVLPPPAIRAWKKFIGGVPMKVATKTFSGCS